MAFLLFLLASSVKKQQKDVWVHQSAVSGFPFTQFCQCSVTTEELEKEVANPASLLKSIRQDKQHTGSCNVTLDVKIKHPLMTVTFFHCISMATTPIITILLLQLLLPL